MEGLWGVERCRYQQEGLTWMGLKSVKSTFRKGADGELEG